MIHCALCPLLFLGLLLPVLSAGAQTRTDSAQSPQRVTGLLDGQGSAHVQMAERNGYPAPAQVLALARELQLTPAQLEATRALQAQLQVQLRSLGGELLAAEARLEALFRAGMVDSVQLQAHLEAISRFETRLRQAHLATHLAQARVLDDLQRQRYGQLRDVRSIPAPSAADRAGP